MVGGGGDLSSKANAFLFSNFYFQESIWPESSKGRRLKVVSRKEKGGRNQTRGGGQARVGSIAPNLPEEVLNG